MKNNIIVYGSAALIVIVLAGYALPDKKISLSERRPLAELPECSVSNVMSGEYMSDMESYLSDHIPGREMLRRIYTFANQHLFLKKEVNGYVQREDSIYRLEEELSTEYMGKNARYFEGIREKFFANNPCYYAIIPDKNYYLDQPLGYQRFDYEGQRQILCSLLKGQYIDIWDCLTLDDYYRTDLHWRQECIEQVRDRLLQEMGNVVGKHDEYEQYVATDSFSGSYLLPSGFQLKPDTIIYLQNEGMQKVEVFDYEKKKQMPLYAVERIGTGDDYDLFLGGAKALLTIENDRSSSNQELIIFRDSYTSSLAPLLTDAYRKITLVDLRYTTPDYALSQITWNADTQILFLYQTTILNGNVFRK